MRSITRLTLTGLCVALLGTGCSAASPTRDFVGPSGIGPSGSIPSPTSTAISSAAPTVQPASPDSWLMVGQEGSAGLQVILASTRTVLFDLPTGAPLDSRWGRILAATPAGADTLIRDFVLEPGPAGASITIGGAWQLPRIGPDPVPVGESLNGRTIVLAEYARPTTDGTTRFALLDGSLSKPARIITLHGRFDFDALSPDGATLYLVEHLDAAAGGAYQVRAVDVASGTLKDGVVADKSQLVEQMAGYPLAQTRRNDGVVLTLYRGREHPFVHALNSLDGWAVCLDLPATHADDAVAAADWGLAPSPDGRSVYAVNATLGLVVELDPTQPGVVRTATVKPLADQDIVLAKFGHQAGGPADRRVVVSSDGRRIYAAGRGGILEIDAASLTADRTFVVGQAVDALALSPDGGSLFALLQARGQIVKLDVPSGRLMATVPGAGYDRLVVVVPW